MNADDNFRAEQIVRTLRAVLAKYKDYRIAMDRGFVLLHPERKALHYHFANKERRFWRGFVLARRNRPPFCIRKPGMAMNLSGRCTLRRRGIA